MPLSERSEFRHRPGKPSGARAAERSEAGAAGRDFLPTLLPRSKRVGRPPGRVPAINRCSPLPALRATLSHKGRGEDTTRPLRWQEAVLPETPPSPHKARGGKMDSRFRGNDDSYSNPYGSYRPKTKFSRCPCPLCTFPSGSTISVRIKNSTPCILSPDTRRKVSKFACWSPPFLGG